MFGHLHGPLGSVASSISMTFFFFCGNNFSVVCEIAKFIIYFCSLRGLRSTPRIVFSCAHPPSHLSFLSTPKIDLLRSCKITDFCSQNEILFLLTWASRGCWSHIFSLIFGSYILVLPRLLSLLRVSEISTTQILLSLFVELLLSLFVELRTSKNLVLPVEFKVSMLLRASVSVLLIY